MACYGRRQLEAQRHTLDRRLASVTPRRHGVDHHAARRNMVQECDRKSERQCIGHHPSDHFRATVNELGRIVIWCHKRTGQHACDRYGQNRSSNSLSQEVPSNTPSELGEGPAKTRHGGGRGIRTPGGLSPTTVFKTAALNRSASPPRPLLYQA